MAFWTLIRPKSFDGVTLGLVTEKRAKKRQASDRPSPDELKRQRDTFLNTFFRKGAEFTEEIVKENERLRRQVIDLESENTELRTQLASDQAMRDLLRKIEQLEREKQALLSHVHEAEAISTRFNNHYKEMEEELSNLAHLYVASYQLHSTLRLNRAVKHLKELLQQLVGAQDYAFYFADRGVRNAVESAEPTKEHTELVLIAKVGATSAPARVIPSGDAAPKGAASVIERAYLTGEQHIVEGPLAGCSMTQPAAVVPMRFDDQVVGAIVVFTVFPQKQNFVAVDFELFKMLSAHAATALAGALLFFSTDGKLPGLEPFAQIAE